jgi:hypothetical protein
MSRKNNRKNRGQNQQPPPAPPPAQLVPQAGSKETETDKRQDRRITWSLVGSAASFLLSLASGVFAYRSANEAAEANSIARAAQDRTAGKVQAHFEFIEEKDRDPNRFKEFMRKKDGFDQQVFRIDSVDELIRWAPHIRIKNSGIEPIDAIKIDVEFAIGAAYGAGVQQINPTPIVYSQVSSHEATTFGKLMPGQTARIDMASLLLQQISRSNLQEFPEKDHLGIFLVKVYCRLVGSSSYDRMNKDDTLTFTFHWRPGGFKPDARNVKEFLGHKPQVEIE